MNMMSQGGTAGFARASDWVDLLVQPGGGEEISPGPEKDLH